MPPSVPVRLKLVGLSRRSGRQTLFIDSSQGFGSAMDHVALAHARDGLMPVQSADAGRAALQNLTHGGNEARPAQAVVRRGQGLRLRGDRCV